MRPIKVYLVRQDDPDEQYYEQFFFLEDAVREHPGEEIFSADIESLGEFEIVTQIKKKKKQKKENENGKT